MDLGKILSLLGVIFLLLGLVYNVLMPNLPKIPGDIYFDKAGFKLYIPFTSSLIISIILTLMLNFFQK